jgi:hypothetical protein
MIAGAIFLELSVDDRRQPEVTLSDWEDCTQQLLDIYTTVIRHSDRETHVGEIIRRAN